MTDTPRGPCGICGRGDGPVCDRCHARMARQLADLPELWRRLRLALVPGAGNGERVTAPRGEAPMPTRLAALSLIAGGSADTRCLFVPAVRVWTTVEQVPAGPAGGLGRPVPTWHREPVRDVQGRLVMTLADDQVGVLPVREWLWAWAVEWRHTFGHGTAVRRPATAGRSPASRAHHQYLRSRLRQACESNPRITDFAASLRALTGAARAALGDVDDLEYLGRCPEDITDPRTDTTTACGAQIWHDPYASVITCPRCHTDTVQQHSVWLARRILEVWPIDRRRRYPRGLIAVLRKPACVTCGEAVRVEWIDATERADPQRFWRPGSVTCPTGCEVALR